MGIQSTRSHPPRQAIERAVVLADVCSREFLTSCVVFHRIVIRASHAVASLAGCSVDFPFMPIFSFAHPR